ncbi:ATP-dependent DNA ligase [Rhizobium sp. BK313]|nr:ATP-dependent DNA ligase [Rhizobium sp. BK313]
MAIHVEPKAVRIVTRGGHDWTARFPAIVAAAKQLRVTTAILNGEAVVLDD